jgi:spermidine synthase
MAEHPAAHLDCVEIHSEILKLAHHFSAVNDRVWTKQHVRLFAEDGRRFVLADGPTYDVIVDDLFLPRNPGVGALFSLEHFQGVRRRLSPDGLFVAWLPLWQLSPWETGVIIRTFMQVFPHAQGLMGDSSPRRPLLGLLSWKNAGAGLDRSWRARSEAFVARSWERIYQRKLPVQQGSIALDTIGSAQLARWADGKPLNTLERPLVEYSAPRTLTRYQLRREDLAQINLAKLRALAAGQR